MVPVSWKPISLRAIVWTIKWKNTEIAYLSFACLLLGPQWSVEHCGRTSLQNGVHGAVSRRDIIRVMFPKVDIQSTTSLNVSA